MRADYVERVAQAIEAADAALLRELVGDLHEADIGDLIEALDAELRPRLVELMGHDFDFTALTEVDDTVREEILEELPAETVAEGVRELDSDDAVDILEDLPKDEQAEILEQLPADERGRAGAQPGLSGKLRRPAHADRVHRGRRRIGPSARPSTTCARPPDLPDRFWELYVVDPDRRARGRGRARPAAAHQAAGADRRADRGGAAAACARPTTRKRWRVCSSATTWSSAPVVDDDDRLVGVITFDDIVDVIEEEAEEDIKALGGVGREEELSDSVWTIAQGPLSLAVRQSCSPRCLASWVISQFEGAIEKMVALAVLMPIVASMGGNAGTQTMTVAVRALATRELSQRQCLARSSGASCWSACSTASALRVIMGVDRGGLVQGRRSRPGHRAGDGHACWRPRRSAAS